MTPDIALDYDLIKENYPFCMLSGPANVLIMPDQEAQGFHISYFKNLVVDQC